MNHGGYLAVENGERSALQNGAVIDSEKTAFVNGQPGDRPTAFLVNDTITYPDGHTEAVHHSFANESYASQAEWNELSAALPGAFDGPNPGDGLRDSMSTAEYAELMEETSETLPGLQDDYAPADFSGVPDSAVEAESMADAGAGTEADSGASAEADGTASDSDSSADADPD